MTCPKVVMSRPRKTFIAPAFTLVELLVVVGIIALIVAFLMPALTRARQRAQQVACLTNIRQFYIALSTYANDFREYPYTFKPQVVGVGPWVLVGEQSCYIGPTIAPLLINLRYVTNARVLKCNATTPSSFPFLFAGLVSESWYCWAGPSSHGGFEDGYGHNSGLRWRSKFYAEYPPSGGAVNTDPHYWGCSVRNRWMRLMADCPSIVYSGDATFGLEPHGDQLRCTFNHQVSEAWFLRRRNALYNDGHAEYWNRDSAGTLSDYQ